MTNMVNRNEFEIRYFEYSPMWMAIDTGRTAVCCPSGVCDTSMAFKGLLEINVCSINHLPKLGNFANFLEGQNLALLVSIDTQTGGIISTIF
jgi:hypothetical protein